VPVQERLTAEQMRATGLDQLEPGQLELLNRLLSADRAVLESAVREQAEAVRTPDRTPIASRVKGAFRGWQKGTVLTLENGRQWRVVDGQLDARKVESPRVWLRPA
jgi:hypothetical protein